MRGKTELQKQRHYNSNENKYYTFAKSVNDVKNAIIEILIKRNNE